MKLLMAFSIALLGSFYVCNKNSHKNSASRVVVIMANYAHETAIATSREEFWLNRKYFDSIEIKSKNLVEYFKAQIKLFKPVTKQDFDHRAAMIIYNDRLNKNDTLYTEEFFSHWNIGDNTYSAGNDYFTKALRPFLLRNIQQEDSD
jgi:hypothetical protein